MELRVRMLDTLKTKTILDHRKTENIGKNLKKKGIISKNLIIEAHKFSEWQILVNSHFRKFQIKISPFRGKG